MENEERVYVKLPNDLLLNHKNWLEVYKEAKILLNESHLDLDSNRIVSWLSKEPKIKEDVVFVQSFSVGELKARAFNYIEENLPTMEEVTKLRMMILGSSYFNPDQYSLIEDVFSKLFKISQ